MAQNKIATILIIVFAIVFVMVVKKKTGESVDNYSHPMITEIKRRLNLIDPSFGKIPIRTGNKSYTEDKSAITLCISDPDTHQLYDINTMMYVALHEVSHVITKASGDDSHKDEFKENFSNLLRQASNFRVYDASVAVPEAYCGAN